MVANMFHILLAILSVLDPEPDEIVAQFLQNSMQGQTVRIQWTQTKTPNPEAQHRYLMHSRSVFEKEASNPKLSLSERDAAKDQMRRIDVASQNAAGLMAQHFQQDFWTDRTNFQIRSPCNQEMGGPFFYGAVPPKWVMMPDSETSQKNLSETFKQIWITSWRPAEQRVFIRWEGRQVASRYGEGVIANQPISGIAFPPLSFPSPDWHGEKCLIDEFFSPGATHARVLGDVVIDGVTTVAMERRWNQGNIFRTMIGYLDLTEGCLPRRLEVYSTGGEAPPEQKWRTPYQLSRIVKGEHFPLHVLKNVVIEKMGGTYFPKSAIIEHLIPIGLNFGDEIAVFSTTSWEIKTVERDRQMPEVMFSFDFPAETLVLDQTKNELTMMGNADEAAKRIVGGIIPSPETSNRAKWILLGVSLSCMLALLGRFRWRKAA